MNIATQTSHKKIHKLPIVMLYKLPTWDAQTSHFRDTNRTSSLFSLYFNLYPESLKTSPLRCRAATAPPSFEGSWKGFPLPNHPFKTRQQKVYRSRIELEKPIKIAAETKNLHAHKPHLSCSGTPGHGDLGTSSQRA